MRWRRESEDTTMKPNCASNLLTLLTALCLLLIAPVVAHAATYYVDGINGNDSNSGAQNKPKKTLYGGFSLMHTGDTLLVADATYAGASNTNINLVFTGGPMTIKSM